MNWRNLTSGELRRMKLHDLIEAYIAATGQSDADAQSYPSGRPALIEELEHLIAQVRERTFASSRQPQRPRADLCKITADECNSFLRSLPVEEQT